MELDSLARAKHQLKKRLYDGAAANLKSRFKIKPQNM
jgi:hypothetical protein